LFKSLALSANQLRLLVLARQRGGKFTSADYQKLAEIDIYTASRDIKDLIRKSVVQAEKKGGRIYILSSGQPVIPEDFKSLQPELSRIGALSNQALRNIWRVDRLQKPVLNFYFYGNKKVIVDVYDFLSGFPYAYLIQTRMGRDIWRLPERGVRAAEVYISRFPKLIKFIAEHEDTIPDDLWGLLFGYPAAEVHLFAYDHDRFMATLPSD